MPTRTRLRAVLASAKIPPSATTVRRATAGDLDGLVALEQATFVLDRMITQQSMQIGFNEIFYLLGFLFLTVIVIVWFARPPFTAKTGAPAGGGH